MPPPVGSAVPDTSTQTRLVGWPVQLPATQGDYATSLVFEQGGHPDAAHGLIKSSGSPDAPDDDGSWQKVKDFEKPYLIFPAPADHSQGLRYQAGYPLSLKVQRTGDQGNQGVALDHLPDSADHASPSLNTSTGSAPTPSPPPYMGGANQWKIVNYLQLNQFSVWTSTTVVASGAVVGGVPQGFPGTANYTVATDVGAGSGAYWRVYSQLRLEWGNTTLGDWPDPPPAPAT